MKLQKLTDLFDLKSGHGLRLNALTPTTADNGVAFVSRKMRDNGVAAYVLAIDDVSPMPAGTMTCALNGNGVLSTFIQERPYYTAYHIACLTPRRPLTQAELIFYAVCIRANRYRYTWGRQANRTLKDLMLPATVPAWANAAPILDDIQRQLTDARLALDAPVR